VAIAHWFMTQGRICYYIELGFLQEPQTVKENILHLNSSGPPTSPGLDLTGFAENRGNR
jgi:hypothetical protein